MLIHNVTIVNEGRKFRGAVLVEGDTIKAVWNSEEDHDRIREYRGERIDGEGAYLLPGVIDDQVHFREPGLTHKGEIFTESRAAAAGGITSYMEMPNTIPQALTQELLEEKYEIAAKRSAVNFSFYMGASNTNIDEVRKTDKEWVCGTKVFMGASTGNMLVDDPETLRKIFAEAPGLVAVHSEDEAIIRANMEKYGPAAVNAEYHPLIRSREACIKSTEKGLKLASEYDTRLHILHISTAEEAAMFDAGPPDEKKVTAEACVHHLWFSDKDYKRKGNYIKWNPAIKTAGDREAIRAAVLSDRIDVVATDHAPHTVGEKQGPYLKAPSGGPLVQHSLVAMLELCDEGAFTIERLVDKMCHAPARLFKVDRRGYIRKGYFADMVLVQPGKPWKVEASNILYKCAWSPFEGQVFNHQVRRTWVNGEMVYHDGWFNESVRGRRLRFA